MTVTRTTCPYCGVGCGVLVTLQGKVSGDPDHPANFGRLCSKGAALGETLGLEGRLLHPIIGETRTDWDSALNLVAEKFATAICDHGPDSVAFYVSGQLLTEDYYVANKLMKGFIGSGNIDTNSRLCMASTVAAQVRSFGEDIVPGCYEDLELADLVVLVGSNTAWCHPVLFQRIAAARAAHGTKVIVIDPRRTETCDIADLHLPLAPGSDVRLWNGLLAHLRSIGGLDDDYLAAHVEPAADIWAALAEADQSTAAIAADCGLTEADVRAFFALYAAHPRTVTAWSQGSNQSQSGTDNVTAILNVHLATGRIGKPGASPFSLTGQPNAMGGREVGGLASTLAAHVGFGDPAGAEIVRRFWKVPSLVTRPGHKAVDLFTALGDGGIKALWIMATNPAVSMPDLAQVRTALADAPFIVVSDVTDKTDTLAFADVRLPALAWGEKDGSVTNSERRISRQRRFLPPPGEARADWWALAQLAARLGFAADFAWESADQIRAEHLALTALTNNHLTITESETPAQWPGGAPRLFADGGFPTASGKARLVALVPHSASTPDPDFPFTLNTGRIRDQWHTMTRTGRVSRLGGHRPEPFVAIHPDDASGLPDASLARVTTAQSSELYRVQHDPGQRRGSLFVPIHWSRTLAAGGLTGALPAAAPDPHSGQPAFKHSRAAIAPHASDWQGFLLTRHDGQPAAEWWVKVAADDCHRFEIAGTGPLAGAADALLPASTAQTITELHDGNRTLRRALFTAGRLDALLFLSASTLPSRDWLTAQFAAAEINPSILAGAAAGSAPDTGRQICACFNIGLKTLTAAIRSEGLSDVAAIGTALGAGSNCGSCKPELARILRDLKESVDASLCA